jgi:Multiubiquitin
MSTDESLKVHDPGDAQREGRASSKSFEITVNSRPREVEAQTVLFEQVVQLAFPGQHEINVVFSMTYRHAASMPHAGELGAGGSIEVKKKGTVFNVTRTVRS